MIEEWRTAIYKGEEYPEYEVSSLGNVRSKRVSNRGRLIRRELAACLDSNGYPTIILYKSKVKIGHVALHRVIAQTFLGPPPDDMEVNHKDGVRDNAAVSNLEYCTRQENVWHGILTIPKVASNGTPYLSPERVCKIRELAVQGVPIKNIAEIVGTNRITVSATISGKQWGFIKTPFDEDCKALPRRKKTSPEIVSEVRRLFYEEGKKQTEIATLFATTSANISRIITKKRHKS